MKAIRIHSFGEPEVMQIEEIPDPQPGPGQVVVRVHAVGINPVETYIRSGIYPKPPTPFTLGNDGAGVIDAVGPEVDGVSIGDRVYYRHTFHPDNRDPKLQELQERVSHDPTPVPTLALHGTKDRPGRLEAFEAMDHLFIQGVEKVILPGTGHFVHVERPNEVNPRIVTFFTAA